MSLGNRCNRVLSTRHGGRTSTALCTDRRRNACADAASASDHLPLVVDLRIEGREKVDRAERGSAEAGPSADETVG